MRPSARSPRSVPDQTGTLTKNETTVRHVITRRGRYDVEGLGYEPQGRVTFDGHGADLEQYPDLRAWSQVRRWPTTPKSPQDEGLWRVLVRPPKVRCTRLGMKRPNLTWTDFAGPRWCPSSPTHKYMATPIKPTRSQAILRQRCARTGCWTAAVTSRMPTGAQPLDRQFWDEQIDHLSNQGRVSWPRPCVRRSEDQTVLDHEDLSGTVFLSIVGIVGPPRPDAVEAITACQQVGIVVKMITGDQCGYSDCDLAGDGHRGRRRPSPQSVVRNWSGRPTHRAAEDRRVVRHFRTHRAPSTNCDWSWHCRPTGRS